ncbi:allergen Tha p 1-like [Leptidea sinapis]|uniref:allergen Tha p 1-like n=1 Tax=Leptidea sinapis TaxID=189913 RepID=UPI002125D97F|nr:allergen Tha p 1-like [Leptidea sinapis]
MNIIITVVFVSLTLVCAEQYTNKYDGINLDEILSNKKVLSAYVNCLLDKGRCSVDGRELKEHVTDALSTGCKKCTGPQKSGVRKVIRHMIKYEKASWALLKRKYDPSGTFARKYEQELKKL